MPVYHHRDPTIRLLTFKSLNRMHFTVICDL